MLNLVGVSPADTVSMSGAERPIDGIDVWGLLLNGSSASPREYLPTTEFSIIWKGRYKLLTNAGGSGWCESHSIDMNCCRVYVLPNSACK